MTFPHFILAALSGAFLYNAGVCLFMEEYGWATVSLLGACVLTFAASRAL